MPQHTGAQTFGAKRHGYIQGLIYWVDPRVSLAWLTGGLIFFGLTMFFRYSYTALICILFLVHLLISSVYSVVQQWNGKSVRSFTHDFKIDKDEASRIALRLVIDYNAAVEWYFGLAAARDITTLATVLVVLFAMWTVATIFSDSGLCLIAFILAFIVPVMYDKNKEYIHSNADKLKEKIISMIPVADKEKPATDKK